MEHEHKTQGDDNRWNMNTRDTRRCNRWKTNTRHKVMLIDGTWTRETQGDVIDGTRTRNIKWC